jgi:hypothetical protein
VRYTVSERSHFTQNCKMVLRYLPTVTPTLQYYAESGKNVTNKYILFVGTVRTVNFKTGDTKMLRISRAKES